MQARVVAVRALVVAASLLLALALIAGHARRAVVDSDQFANRASAALRDDSVRTLIADKVTDEVVLRQEADLIAARPIIESAASGIIGSRAFTSLFRAAVRDAHRAVFDRDRDTVILTVADIGTLLAAAIEKLRPELAEQLEATGRVELVKRDVGSVGGDLARLGDDVRLLAAILFVAAVLMVVAVLAVAPDRRRAVVELGIGAAMAGIVLAAAYAVVRSYAIGHVEGAEARAAAAGVWDAFLADLRTAAWILAGSGAVVAAAAASLLRPVDVREPLRRVAAWVVTEPGRPWLRVLRGVAFLAAGVLVILEGDAVLQLALSLAGVYFIYAGVTVILRLVYRAPAPAGPERPTEAAVSTVTGRRGLVVPLVATAIIAGAVVIFVGSGGVTTAAPAGGPCNGDAALCERALDEIALPATHNSMSVPLPGWYSAEQDRPIPDQLDDGIRGLLIDTYYADRLPNGRLRTYFGSQENLRRRAKQDGVSPAAVDAALRIRERLGFAGEGERGRYLCHTFCELGATALAATLDEIRDFLVANPNEVLVIIVQDSVNPEDFVAAVRVAELEELAYTLPTDGPWPTLREMIARNERVVFLAEKHAGAAPWYQLAYEAITQETPFFFPTVQELTDPERLPASCEPNRGPSSAPLFLINHWVSTQPVQLPSDAAKVNAYDALLRRARECQRLRGHFPNLLTVNFYRQGDLFRVTKELNRVDGDGD